MKIPKAQKLPSGNWRVGLMVDGKRISITEPTKKAAESKAAAIKAGMKAEAAPASLTVGKAIDLYIASKDSRHTAVSVSRPAALSGLRHAFHGRAGQICHGAHGPCLHKYAQKRVSAHNVGEVKGSSRQYRCIF